MYGCQQAEPTDPRGSKWLPLAQVFFYSSTHLSEKIFFIDMDIRFYFMAYLELKTISKQIATQNYVFIGAV